jgi:hypothetical protein
MFMSLAGIAAAEPAMSFLGSAETRTSALPEVQTGKGSRRLRIADKSSEFRPCASRPPFFDREGLIAFYSEKAALRRPFVSISKRCSAALWNIAGFPSCREFVWFGMLCFALNHSESVENPFGLA